MTRLRVRQWLGRHPIWAINLFVLVWLTAALWMMYSPGWTSSINLLGGLYHPPSSSHLEDLEESVFRHWPITPGLLTAPAAALVFLVGTIRGRAGLPARRLWLSLLWSPALCLSAMTVVDALRAPYCKCEDGRTWTAAFTIKALEANAGHGLPALLPFLLGAAALGWLGAALFTRHMLRTGRWEVTVPVEVPKAEGAP